ncbi:MAG: hypothetical protein PWP24_1948 [Clostridiales bacterium]|nr:hypothetical protein [Clostridiales bacterium]
MQKELLIIIPAYNEEENIKKVLEQLEDPEISSIADILVMNDASFDATNWVVKGRSHALVTHVFNLGYGSALQLGYKYAIRRGYQYVIQMDADGQHDVCNVVPIYQRLKMQNEVGQSPDIVLGSRYLKESAPYETPAIKEFAYRLFRGMIRLFTKRTIMDPTSGLQGLSRRAVLYYSKYNHFDDKYPDANMITQMILLGFRVEEIPATMHPRLTGESIHSGIKPAIYMLRMFFSIFAVSFRIKILKKEGSEGVTDGTVWKHE